MRVEYQEYEAAIGWWRGYVDTDAECTCHQCSGDSPSCAHHYAGAAKNGRRGVKHTAPKESE